MASPDEVPRVVLVFSGLVSVGTMMNFTLAIPVSTYYASSIPLSAVVIGVYAVGALVSLGVFQQLYGVVSLRTSYLVHCASMLSGNAMLVLSAVYYSRWPWLPYAARFVVGLEGGCMFTTNAALVAYSRQRTRTRYLALYQFFVGSGLVLGPSLSAAGIAVGRALGQTESSEAYASALMCVWGVVLAFALVVWMPTDEVISRGRETKPLVDRPASPLRVQAANLSLIGWGNFVRISQRVGWEVGAILVCERGFGWGIVPSAFFVASYGAAQTVAQLAYAGAPKINDAKDALTFLEVVEILGISGIFLGAPATRSGTAYSTRVLCETAFALGSLLFYVGNCLTSAPYNAHILGGDQGNVDERKDLLVATQVGVFCAFGASPVYVRVAFYLSGTTPSILAACLLYGWGIQTALTAVALGGRVDAGLEAAIGLAAAALVAWCALDPYMGGTGVTNVFSWHPVLMALAFFGPMTLGQIVYRDDVAPGLDRPTKRRYHGAFMALAFAIALGGYAAIYVAHLQSGESEIGINETPPRQAHVAMGYIAFFFLAIQTVSGPVKAALLEVYDGRRVAIWHGTLGRLVLLYGYVVSALGFWLHMNYSGPGWDAGLKLGLTALAAALLVFVGLPFLSKPRHQPSADLGAI